MGVPIFALSLEDLEEAQATPCQDSSGDGLAADESASQLSEIWLRYASIDKDFERLASRGGRAHLGLMDANPATHGSVRGSEKLSNSTRQAYLGFSLLRYSLAWHHHTRGDFGYMYRTLTHRERELNRAKVTERAGAERAKDLSPKNPRWITLSLAIRILQRRFTASRGQ